MLLMARATIHSPSAAIFRDDLKRMAKSCRYETGDPSKVKQDCEERQHVRTHRLNPH